MWASRTEQIDEPVDEDAAEKKPDSVDEEAAVEEDKEEDKPKTKKVRYRAIYPVFSLAQYALYFSGNTRLIYYIISTILTKKQ